MIRKLLTSSKGTFATRMYAHWKDLSHAHPPTVDLWLLGDGKIDKKEVLVSGWNVNGIRAILKKNELDPFLEKHQPDWLCIN